MRLEARIVDEEVRLLIRDAQAQLGPVGMRKLFLTLGNQQIKSTFENFEKQNFDGEDWPPLSEVTQSLAAESTQMGRDKATGRFTGKETVKGRRENDNILHPTGTHLLQTISMEHTEDFARVFTPTPWAHVHNEGGELVGTAFGNIEIPQRTFLGISEADQEDIVAAVEWHLGQVFG